jgi:putative SOS response-associated peptidase YedK
MCGRYVRARAGLEYLAPLVSGHGDFPVGLDVCPSWNIAPGTCQPIVYPAGTPRRVRWGYRAPWAMRKRPRTIIDATSGNFDSSAWKALWRNGRVIVPGDGWFEWVDAVDGSQPYFIRRMDGEPLFMAALTSQQLETEAHDGDGFMIVVTAADAGPMDVHALRPVVFAAPDARVWLDPDTSPELASYLVHRVALAAGSFDRFAVSRAVNWADRQDGPSLIERTATPR